MPRQHSTPVTIPATMAHRKFGELIRRVFPGKEHFIVEKDGLPVAAVIPMAEYHALLRERAEREERVRRFEEIARRIGEQIAESGLSEEEIMAQLEETKRRVYEETYGRGR